MMITQQCVHLHISDVLILILFLLDFYNVYDDYTTNIAVKKKTLTQKKKNIYIYIFKHKNLKNI